MDYFVKIIKNYANFKGRASRIEYWMGQLFFGIYYIVAIVLDMILESSFIILESSFIITVIYFLALIVPMIAVLVRRLHDIGKKGTWLLIYLIPLIGGIWLLALTLTKGQVGENIYGPDPKAEENIGRESIA